MENQDQGVNRYLLLALLLCMGQCAFGANVAALQIDGVFDEPAWAQAQTLDELVLVEPFTKMPAHLKTTVRVLAQPEGLALAFVCTQPPEVTRTAAVSARDATPKSDAVTAVIDFDGTGQRAYQFTVGLGGAQADGIVSSEVSVNPDWDGVWQSAVTQTEAAWNAELLIPWSAVPMRTTLTDQRHIAISVNRAVWSLGEVYAYPAISNLQSRYLSDFVALTVPSFSQSKLSIVPYASIGADLLGRRTQNREGVDVSWRPSSQFGLTAAIRPDFGQVEADTLVLNFDAVEVFNSDKRPFFTENQALFQVGAAGYDQLVYTRRMGAESEIEGALKLNGSANGFEYGALVANETDTRDLPGSQFAVLRVQRSGERLTAGYLFTHVEGDQRQASVNSVDLQWRPNATQSVNAILIRSQIAEIADSAKPNSNGFGAGLVWKFAGDITDFSVTGNHYGRDLDFNDLGFQARSSLNQLEISGTIRPKARPDTEVFSYNGYFSARRNDSGVDLGQSLFLYRQGTPVGGGFSSLQFQWESAAFDDLSSRGNGLLKRPARVFVRYARQSRPYGKWQFNAGVQNYQEGLSSEIWHGRAWNIASGLSYQATDRLSLDSNVRWRASPDWLTWRTGNLFARYQRHQFISNLNVNWIPSRKHELRLKLQSNIINARNARAVRLGPNGDPYAVAEQIAPLQVRSFGLQLRYRYEFAPLRELYVVYARGGVEREDDNPRDSFELFQDSFLLRKSDQFLVKMRWGF